MSTTQPKAKPGRKSAAELAIVPPAPEFNTPAPGVLPEPPPHLSPGSATWWRQVVSEFSLEPHHLRLLQSAAEAWDRMAQARDELAAHGSLTFTDNRGAIKAHPAEAIERNARIAFARLVRELDLDAGAPAERSRPPALLSNRR